MTRYSQTVLLLIFSMAATSCSRKTESATPLKATAFGTAIAESSGGKQNTQTGSLLPQPVVVQVNDEQEAAVASKRDVTRSLRLPSTNLIRRWK